jgi:hypothetical protein
MAIQKQCADHLRVHHTAATGGRLSSGHAHELVAAFFGYPTAAALQAEPTYLLDYLPHASVLIPDLARLEARRLGIAGLPADLADADDIATVLEEFLTIAGHFSGDVWHTWDLQEYINTDFMQPNALMIEDALSGEIGITNAYFDELYVEEVEISRSHDGLTAVASGSLNGESDPDRAFHGDKIAFETHIALDLVAGRTGFAKPQVKTDGAVDDSRYYEE